MSGARNIKVILPFDATCSRNLKYNTIKGPQCYEKICLNRDISLLVRLNKTGAASPKIFRCDNIDGTRLPIII